MIWQPALIRRTPRRCGPGQDIPGLHNISAHCGYHINPDAGRQVRLGTGGDTRTLALETMATGCREWSHPSGHRAYLRLRVQSRISDRNR